MEGSSEVPSDCSWILDLLWGAGSGTTWAPKGRLPAGYRRTETMAVLPAGRGRSFTITLGTGNAAARALSSYGALRSPRQRLARHLAGVALTASAGRHTPFRMIDVGVAERREDEGGEGPIGDHLARLLGARRVLIAFGGGRGPYRKPVLQIFDEDGAPLAYVKVAWNDWSRQAVAAEAAALRAIAGRRDSAGSASAGSASGGSGGGATLRAPRLIAETSWNDLSLLVVEPLPPQVRGVPLTTPLPPVGWLRQVVELGPCYEGELAASGWWSGIRRRIAATEAPTRPRLQAVADSIERTYGSTVLSFGAWHGDLVPWNLATIGEQLYAFDWESSAMEAPVGLDAVHYHFQISFVEGGAPVAKASDLARGLARAALAELGAGRHATLLSICHLLELTVRHEQARMSSGDIDRRFFPDVLRVLESERAALLAAGTTGAGDGEALRRSA